MQRASLHVSSRNVCGRVGDLAAKFLRGLGSLRSPREVLLIFLTSIIIWTIETLTYWFVMQAFPFAVSFPALMLMTAVVNLFTMIPSAPGYVGTFDKAGVQVLKSFGVLGTLATAYTVLLHFTLWLPITMLGLFYMSRESLRWRDISVAAGESQSGGTVERQVPGPSSLGIVLALAGLATLSGYL